MKIKFISLASGSSGNCYFLGTDRYGILVDAGIGIRTIKKTLKELEGKISDEEKAKVEAELANVKKELEGNDTDKIKAASEKLTQVFYDISSKLYSKAGGAEAGANAEAGASTDGNNAEENVVHDADYKVEDDNKKE